MLNGELAALHVESQLFPDTPSHNKHLHSTSSLWLSNEEADNSPDSESESDSDYTDEEEEHEAAWQAVCTIDPEALSKVDACISGTIVPTWIGQQPSNLGEKSHRRLKALYSCP